MRKFAGYNFDKLPARPVPWGIGIPNQDSLQEQIFQDLVAKGLPPGIALQQAAAARAMMHNTDIDSSGYNQAQLMSDAQRGYTSLSPAQIYGIRSMFADPAHASEYGSILSSPAAQRLLQRGMGSWKNADPDTAYQQALKITSEQVKSNLAARGIPVSSEEAQQIALRYIGDRARFHNFNDVANAAGSSRAVGEISDNVGTNLGIGAGMHMFQDAFLGSGAAPAVGWKATYNDAKHSLLPTMGLTRPVDEARNALQAAIRSGDQIAIANARQGLFEAAKAAPRGLAGLGNAVPAAFGAMPLAFGGYQALSNNSRGETATDFIKRIAGVGYPGSELDWDRDDAITIGSIAPHAIAQGYLFNTLPTQLGSQLKSNPVGALRNSLVKGTLATTAPEALTRAATMMFGTDTSKNMEARRVGNERRELERRHALSGFTANMDPTSNGGALEGISSRGIFGHIRNNFEGAGVGDIAMGGLQSLADVGMAPLRLAAQYGVGVPADIATMAVNKIRPGTLDPTTGSKLRNFADPATALSQGLNSGYEFINGKSPEDVYDSTKGTAKNRAAEAAEMRNRVPASPAPMGADDKKVEPK